VGPSLSRAKPLGPALIFVGGALLTARATVLAVCNPNPILESGILDPMGAISRYQSSILIS
jgi:hypothetical protein